MGLMGGIPIGSGICPKCGKRGQFEIGLPDAGRRQLLVFHKQGAHSYLKSCYIAIYDEIAAFIKKNEYTGKGQTCHEITVSQEAVRKARKETWRKISLKLKKMREERQKLRR